MAECLFTVTPEQIQDILGHITEGVCRPFKVHIINLDYFTIIFTLIRHITEGMCRPFKVHINNLVYLTIILTLVPSSCHYIDCLLLFIYLYCDNFSSENIHPVSYTHLTLPTICSV